MWEDKIKFNRDDKYDIQLDAALVAERRLAETYATEKFEKIELKTEKWLWRRTGNIAIEYRRNGQPSGISVTQADHWVHQCRSDDGATAFSLTFPVPRLKVLCRAAIKAGRTRRGGDDNLSDMVILRLRDLWDLM